MDRIILEADDRSAKRLLTSDDDFWKFVDKLSAKAESNELTEE